jgi:hypothetical protein
MSVLRMILLTKSRKNGNYCIAGVNPKTGNWLRLVSQNKLINYAVPQEDVKYEDGTEAQILDIIEVTILKENPLYYQPENYIYDPDFYWAKVGRANLNEVIEMVNDNPDRYIFFDTRYKLARDFIISNVANEIYSLKLIHLDEMDLYTESRDGSNRVKHHASFRYNNNNYRFIKITDDEYIKAYPNEGVYQIRNAAIVVSLADLYEYDECHYKLIASIIHS